MQGFPFKGKKLSEAFCLIHPDSPVLKFWDTLLLLILAYYVVIQMFEASFSLISPIKNYIILLHYCFHFFFLVDMVLNSFFIPNSLNWSDQWETSRMAIFKKYMIRKFLWNLLPFIPLSFFNDFLIMMDLFRLQNFQRLGTQAKNLLRRLLQKIITKASAFLSFYSIAVSFLKFFLEYFILIHLLTCFWIFLSSFKESGSQNSEENWLFDFPRNTSKITIYIDSLYFILGTFSKTGLATKMPAILQMLFVSLVQLVSILLFGYTIAVITKSYTQTKLSFSLKAKVLPFSLLRK